MSSGSGGHGIPIIGRVETPTLAANQAYSATLTSTGELRIASGSTAVVVAGNNTPSDNYANPTDALDCNALISGWDGATWDRILTGAVTVGTSPAGFLTTHVRTIFETTPTTLTNGQYGQVHVDASQNLKTAEQFAPGAEDNTNGIYAIIQKLVATNTYAPTLHTNFGAATKAVVKASAGNVFAFRIYNENAAVRYFQLHNKATAPAGGDTPLYSFSVPAGSATAPGSLVLDAAWFCGSGGYFSTGIGWAISTTESTFTDAATASEHAVHVHYN